jgi:plastocyanin
MSGQDNVSYTFRKNSTPFVIDRTPGQNDSVLIYTANNSQTAYIPDASTVTPGKVVTFVNASSGTLTILCVNQLDGVPGGSKAPAKSASFLSDGFNWFTVDVT